MNKTLQYILVFVIFFAAAMLVGRLFKSDKKETSVEQKADSINASTIDSSIYYEFHPKDTTPEFRAFLTKIDAQKDFIHPSCGKQRMDVGVCSYKSDSLDYEYHRGFFDRRRIADKNKDTFNVFDSSGYLVIISGRPREQTKIKLAKVETKNKDLYLHIEDEVELFDFNHDTNEETIYHVDGIYNHFAKFIIKYPKAYKRIYLQDSLIWTNKNK